MLVVGLVFGRWWWLTIPLGTVGWVLATMATGAVTDFSGTLGAAAFGVANVIVGVLIYQALALSVHALRRFRKQPSHVDGLRRPPVHP
jgi:hypothetical protein